MDKETFTNIKSAIKSGDQRRILELFESNPQNLHETSPLGNWLHVASVYGQLESLKILVKLGLDINLNGGLADSTPINVASARGYSDIVDWLIRQGAILDVSEPERNPLISSIINNHIDIGKLLIDAGIDTKVTYPRGAVNGMDALAYAKERGADAFVDLLRI